MGRATEEADRRRLQRQGSARDENQFPLASPGAGLRASDPPFLPMIATARDRRHDLSSWSGQQRRRCLHRGGGDEEDKCRLFPSPGVDPLSQFLRSLWSRPVPLWYRFPSAHRRARAKEAPVQESQSRRGGPGRKSQVGERTQLSPPPISASLDACSSSWALSQLPLPLPLSLSLSL